MSSSIDAITYWGAKAVTPDDAAKDPAGPFAGFYTGTGGDIKVHTVRGDDVTFHGTIAGVIVPCAITRVWSTGTAATNVLGMIASPYGNRP